MFKLRYLVYFIIVYCYFQYAMGGYGNKVSIITQVDDVLIIILSILVLLYNVKHRGFKILRNFSSWFLLGFIFLFIISGYLNHVPAANFLLAIKTYLIYFIFFLCLINLPLDSHRIIRLMIICFLFQLPIMVVQLAISILTKGNFTDDTMYGTFPGANTLGYAVFFILFFTTYMFWIQKKKEYKYPFWFMLLILFAVRADYAIVMYFCLFFLLFFKKILLNRRSLLISFALIIFVIVIGIAGSSGPSAQKSLGKILNPAWWVNNITVQQNEISSGAQRNLYFPLTYQHLHRFAAHPLIGMGPGMYASYVVDKYPTRFSDLILDVFEQTKYGLDAGVDSEIIPLWGEFGYLGILIFTLFLLYSCLHFKNVFKRVSEPQTKGYALIASVGSFFLLLGFYTNKLWESQPVFMTLVIFWALAVQAERSFISKTARYK
jgi:hypothetical protein